MNYFEWLKWSLYHGSGRCFKLILPTWYNLILNNEDRYKSRYRQFWAWLNSGSSSYKEWLNRIPF
jgi:hypothetical protein